MAGEVSGTPGTAYPNRTDLNAQPIRAASGQPYGQRGAQEAAQRAVPLPQERPLPTPIGAPSSRPGEPVTSGMPTGEGRNAMSNSAVPQGNPTLDALRALYMAWPTDDLRELIQRVEETGR